jgi:hypothetical protein
MDAGALSKNRGPQKEETVEELIKKLQNRGTKVKILGDDEDEKVKPTPKQKSSKKDSGNVDIHNLVDTHDQANKENAPVGAE